MIQIRKGLYETNSSSVHTIVLDKADIKGLPKRLIFDTEDYGWEFEIVKNTCNYLWTLIIDIIYCNGFDYIYEFEKEEQDKKPETGFERLNLIMQKIASTFEKVGVETEFSVPAYIEEFTEITTDRASKINSLQLRRKLNADESVDNSLDAADFVKKLLSDDELLIKFCCGANSEIITGNDNISVKEFPEIEKELKRVNKANGNSLETFIK